MRIDYLKINGFGKIEDREIEFGKNINVVSGENETGKSTLLKCILAMFYGVSKNKNGKDISDMERYKPWGNAEFSGKMKYTLDSGKTMEVFRDFSKKNPQIFNENSEDITKTFNIDKTKGNEFFFEQTRIDEDMLISTGIAEQQKVVLDEKEKTSLTQKIANILTSGNENVSYKKAIEKLNKDLIENIGTERTVGRPINIVEEKLEKIKEKINSLRGKEERINEINYEKQLINTNINDLKERLGVIKQIKGIKEKENIEEEKIKVKELIIDDYKEKIRNIKNQNPKNSTNLWLETIINAIIVGIGIVACIHKNLVIALISLILAVFLLVYMVLKYNKLNQIKNNQSNEIKVLEDNMDEKEEEAKEERQKIKDNTKNEIEKIINTLNNHLVNELEGTFSYDVHELENSILDLEEKISNQKIDLNTIEIEEKNILKELDQKIELEEELENVLQEKEDLLKEAKRIKLTKELLESAYNKMKSEITPKLTRSISKIAEKISNGKYKNVVLNDEEGLFVELENGEYIDANRLSVGTVDQLYLSLRLSAFKEITNESIPIILDESFAYYDNTRLANILKYLNENFKENQIIIFTCTNREKELLDKMKIEYNIITL